MNGISFTPQVNYGVTLQNRPSFTGVKKPTAAQAKSAGNFLQGLYRLFFVPGRESVVKIAEGSVYTEKVAANGAKRISKKYPMWSKVPSEIVEDNIVTSLRTRRKFNTDGTYDLLIRDMHVPEYNITVGYEKVAEPKSIYASDFQKGKLRLQYCDKELVLSEEQREGLVEQFRKVISDRYDEPMNKMLNTHDYSNFQEFSEKFYKDPDVIAQSIVNSPQSLQAQLKRISTSMPYGVERIFECMGK